MPVPLLGAAYAGAAALGTGALAVVSSPVVVTAAVIGGGALVVDQLQAAVRGEPSFAAQMLEGTAIDNIYEGWTDQRQTGANQRSIDASAATAFRSTVEGIETTISQRPTYNDVAADPARHMEADSIFAPN